jgi:hypothetical protein
MIGRVGFFTSAQALDNILVIYQALGGLLAELRNRAGP